MGAKRDIKSEKSWIKGMQKMMQQGWVWDTQNCRKWDPIGPRKVLEGGILFHVRFLLILQPYFHRVDMQKYNKNTCFV